MRLTHQADLNDADKAGIWLRISRGVLCMFAVTGDRRTALGCEKVKRPGPLRV
jgi:hypothetical protein